MPELKIIYSIVNISRRWIRIRRGGLTATYSTAELCRNLKTKSKTVIVIVADDNSNLFEHKAEINATEIFSPHIKFLNGENITGTKEDYHKKLWREKNG